MCRRGSQVCDQGLRRSVAAVNAIGNAYTAIGIPGQDEAREVASQCLKAGDTLHMPEVILRHGVRVTADAKVRGLAGNPEELLQILAYGVLHSIVGEFVLLGLQGATDEGAQEHEVIRSATGEFDAAKRTGHQRALFDRWHYKPHAVQRMRHLIASVGHIDGGRGGIGNVLQD